MKTRKQILACVQWQQRQRGRVRQWLIIVATGILMWFVQSLGALAATTHFHDRMEDVRWLWRDRTIHLGTLALITVVVVASLLVMNQLQRRQRSL